MHEKTVNDTRGRGIPRKVSLVDQGEHRGIRNPSDQVRTPVAVPGRRSRKVVGLQQMELDDCVCPRSLKLLSSLFQVNLQGEIEWFYPLVYPILDEFFKGHIDLGTLKFVYTQMRFLHGRNMNLDEPWDQINRDDSRFDTQAAETYFEAHWRTFAHLEAYALGNVIPKIQVSIEFCDKE